MVNVLKNELFGHFSCECRNRKFQAKSKRSKYNYRYKNKYNIVKQFL